MKKLNGKYKPPPSLSVIEAARAGEADAMEQILQYYDGYINKLCLRTIIDESGQTHKQVDPYKVVITFNYKEGTSTITFDGLKSALNGKNTGSDLDCLTAPCRSKLWIACSDLFYMSERAHAAAPPFQTEPAYAGLRFGAALRAAFFLSVLTVCSKFESHVLAN